MIRFVLDLVKLALALGRTALQVAALPITIPFGIVFGRSIRRAKTAALLVGVGAAAGALAAASTDRARA